MPKQLTLEKLTSWTPEKRLRIYQNAKNHPNGKAVIALIDQNGLSLSSGELTADDPVVLTMIQVIWSAEGRAAALEAMHAGLPAVSGVDILLQTKLGDRYYKHDKEQ